MHHQSSPDQSTPVVWEVSWLLQSQRLPVEDLRNLFQNPDDSEYPGFTINNVRVDLYIHKGTIQNIFSLFLSSID